MIDDAKLRSQIRRLETVYPTKRDTDDLLQAWKWVLADELAYDELMSAVSEYAKSPASYFPSPGKLLEIALRQRSDSGRSGPVRAVGWDQSQEGPCPVCGASLKLLTPEERGQTHVFDAKAWTSIPIATLREMGADVPPSIYGIVHDLRQHETAGVPAIGFGR